MAGHKNRPEKVGESRQKGEFPSSEIWKCPGGEKFGRFLLPKKKADAMIPCKFTPTAAEQVEPSRGSVGSKIKQVSHDSDCLSSLPRDQDSGLTSQYCDEIGHLSDLTH